ncbi:MAG: glycosyltransferase [Flavobacteriales bacterium]|jgi:cellulose synthase/poly-beta-1,6-N-acetylglucosamine synthase-like glycosyltransferase|nr:glycosyltransferase [Flavobacteriales bacterium]
MDISVFQTLPDWQLALIVVFTATLAVLIVYYFFFFIRLSLYKPNKERSGTEPVSVIICAWNEEENLKKNLQSILEQDYPEYEVIVVNDHSLDETDLLLQSWQGKYEHLRVINLTKDNVNMRGKKFAISMGIKGAKYDHLLFTDADCRPKSRHWLRFMANGLSDKKELVLGYGGFEKEVGLFNKLYRYEAVHTAMQYFSYALAGIPYMGVGRNLAYNKELFFKSKGFVKHRHLASGDDDLMVNEVATGKNTEIEVRNDAHTVSAPQKDITSWWRQKRRHLTTGGYYKFSSKFFLGFYALCNVLFYLTFFIVLSTKTMYWYALCGIVIKWIVHLSIIRGVLRALDEGDLLLFSLLGDLFSPFFNAVVAISNLIKPPVRWR